MIVDRSTIRFNRVSEAGSCLLAEAIARSIESLDIGAIYLSGSLGAGKTTIARGILRSLGVEGRIKSPSFAIAELYELPDLQVHHIDLYRLQDPLAWRSAGLREAYGPGRLVLLEWPEHGHGLPGADLMVSIDWFNEEAEGPRQVMLSAARPEILSAIDTAIGNALERSP